MFKGSSESQTYEAARDVKEMDEATTNTTRKTWFGKMSADFASELNYFETHRTRGAPCCATNPLSSVYILWYTRAEIYTEI